LSQQRAGREAAAAWSVGVPGLMWRRPAPPFCLSHEEAWRGRFKEPLEHPSVATSLQTILKTSIYEERNISREVRHLHESPILRLEVGHALRCAACAQFAPLHPCGPDTDTEKDQVMFPKVSPCAGSVVALLLAAVMSGGGAQAQDVVERVLIPVVTFDPIPGANGSLWDTELVVTNTSSAAIRVHGVLERDCHGLPCTNVETVPPRTTMTIFPIGGSDRLAALVRVEGAAESVFFNLRVRDLSRQSETWGTQLPVVRDQDLRTGTTVLANIPIEDQFRQTLRIYGMADDAGTELRLRLYEVRVGNPGNEPPTLDSLLGEKVVTLRPPIGGESDQSPQYFELSDLKQIGPLGTTGRVSLHVEPVTTGHRYWALLSVTHNATQHVTTIAP
jgi:hypothetical protein